jgi:hypothetical protein
VWARGDQPAARLSYWHVLAIYLACCIPGKGRCRLHGSHFWHADTGLNTRPRVWQVALQTAAFALAADCHSITFTPGYQSTVETPRHAGGRCTQIRLRASNGWQIDLEEVRAAIREDTRYMVINQPYNPAGTLMSADLQAELVAMADSHGESFHQSTCLAISSSLSFCRIAGPMNS